MHVLRLETVRRQGLTVRLAMQHRLCSLRYIIDEPGFERAKLKTYCSCEVHFELFISFEALLFPFPFLKTPFQLWP